MINWTCPKGAGLPFFVSVWFQLLFHSPHRGTFHLSLTVLVHYRSQRVFSLASIVEAYSHKISRVVWYLRNTVAKTNSFLLRGYHRLWPAFPDRSDKNWFFYFDPDCKIADIFLPPKRAKERRQYPRNPLLSLGLHPSLNKEVEATEFRLFPVRSPLLRECSPNKFGASFLFLWILRCFNSPGAFHYSMDSNNDSIIFNYTGLPHSEILGSTVGCHLPEAYRRLPRPSSALCAKASTIRPWLDKKL